MSRDLDELTRVVGTMPRDMVREVLNFAMFLQRTHARRMQDPTDWEDDVRDANLLNRRHFEAILQTDD
jgi:hypothetical protein